MELKSKTILITGSSRGIGKAIAKYAYDKGYKVIVHGRNDSDELNKTHQELKGSIKTFFDVSDKAEVQEKIAELLAEAESIDGLVNNAGIARNFLKDISEVDDEKALDEYRTNVLGAIHVTQAVLPSMVKNKSGSIVNITSIKSFPELATMSTFTFAASKSALKSITKSLAKTYASFGIRVNAVAPGYIETDQVKDWNEQTFKRINEGTLLERIGQATEIAPIVVFLLSDESSYITGTEVLADGGYMLKGK